MKTTVSEILSNWFIGPGSQFAIGSTVKRYHSHKPPSKGLLLAVALACLCLPAGSAQAQQPSSKTKINAQVVQMLVKSAIMALNHGNLTGNYSVLRELGTIQFQASTSSRTLIKAFESLRRDNIDLAGTLVYPALLRSAPQVKDNLVRFTGVFETRPSQVSFDMSYRFVNSRWRINSLSVNIARPAEPVSGKSNAQTNQ